MDAQFVENIVHEVKSQGVFDEFRKDSMADVDTKPAYQNLRQRVENTVKKFLADQKWRPDMNKNQLREKLRKHITESGFLDVGVERIVDQVVNPKIGSVFQPRIEEIVYKYLGLPPPPKKYEHPPPPLMHPLPPLPLNGPPLKVETCSLLPTDLEQVSPESDKGTVKFEVAGGNYSISETVCDMETDDKMLDDEDESPPFEPLVKQEIKEEKEGAIKEDKLEKVKYQEASFERKQIKIEEGNDTLVKTENLLTDNDSRSTFAPDMAALDKEASQSMDARISQDSQLSSVSSDSRLSANGKEDSLQSSSQEAVAANISEEAQMPKFNENSSEPNNASERGQNEKTTKISELHFDIKKDEIKFQGTERKCNLDAPEVLTIKTEQVKYAEAQENLPQEKNKDSFKFSSNNSNLEAKFEDVERTPINPDSSFGSSIDDSSSVPANCTPKASGSENKEKEVSTIEKSPLLLTPKQQTLPTTPNTTPILTPNLPTPAATPSPITSQKIEKDTSSRHSSSSSSKHKKHSKERRRSNDREKDKDRYRSGRDSKEYSSKYHSTTSSGSKGSKHSSSYSSKSSSSHNKSTEKDLEKSSSSSTHSSKHSKNSQFSSSNEHDSRHRKRDSDRRHHSSSGSHREHSSSSGKRNEKKDDHTEAKHKLQRRKSTDSNDDEDGDKSMGGGKPSSQYRSSYSTTSASKSSKSKSNNDVNQSPTAKTNDSQKDTTQLQTTAEPFPYKPPQFLHNNVVILNDLLENPQTQYVQLGNTGHLVETPLEYLTNSLKKEEFVEFNNNNELPKTILEEKVEVNTPPTKFEGKVELNTSQIKLEEEVEVNTSQIKLEEKVELNIPQIKFEEKVDPYTSPKLLYFEEPLSDYKERLELFDKNIDLCRSSINYLRFDSTLNEAVELANEDLPRYDNKSNLLTETLKRKPEMDYEEFEKTPRKRVASSDSEECPSKTSPTPSDSSVNSKENEEIDKNTDLAKKPVMDRHKAVQKLNQQQRYSSEDLYKPRPILGQRSRRRGMDSLV